MNGTALGERAPGPVMRRTAGVLATALLVAASGGAARAGDAGRRPAPVEPRFELTGPGHDPFPADRWTVPDPAQRTGLRVALPLPSCATARSACDDLRLLDELDGFDLAPRLVLPFSGPIDVGSVTARSVFLVRLAPGPPEATGVERLVYDPAAHTLYARPETLLEPETRYGLVVTRELTDLGGRPIGASPAFHRLLRSRGGPPALRGYREALGRLVTALARRGVRSEDVAVASVFTTGSVTTFLERAREALDQRPPPPALVTAPEGGGRAWFPRAAVTGLVLRRQVRVATDGEDAFRDEPLPLAALPPDAVAGVGVGWYWSSWYLSPERRIVEPGTARPLAPAPGQVPVPFVVVLPAGTPPAGGWPLAIFGHGYGGEMLSGALAIAGTLAHHGIATIAVTVVGHGGGPGSRLLVSQADGRTRVVRVPGRGIDQDGDGVIGRTEGLTPPARGPLVSLSVRDGLRQQTVDLIALVRALRGGLDVDGDGVPDTGERISYVGHSLGGIYGTLFLAVDPRVKVGVLNVPGGSIAEIARLSPIFRPFLRDTLAQRVPPLLNRADDFRDDLPLRGDPPVVGVAPGALAIQEYLSHVEWLGRRGDPLAYARHLSVQPLAGHRPARVLVQITRGDRVVPNPTTSALVRAGQLGDTATLLRYDRVLSANGTEWTEPHGLLLRVRAPGPVGALARVAQEQVARFFLSGGAAVWDPEQAAPRPFGEAVFEVPAASLPDGLGFEPAGSGPDER